MRKWAVWGFAFATAIIVSSVLVSCYSPPAAQPPRPVYSGKKTSSKGLDKTYEPSYQSSEYNAIQLAFVNKLKSSLPLYPARRRYKIRFDMGYLRVKEDWAFAHAHLWYRKYESQKIYTYPAALLHRSNKKNWRVVALLDTNFNWDSKDGRSQSDVGKQPSVGEKTWVKEMEAITRKWRTQFPSAPKSIFLSQEDMHYQDLGTSQWF